jgi:predicted AlkP superfamily phosphohydrolase/phosphomutase
MMRRRILLIGLDGFDIGLAERFLNEGELPNIARLRMQGARYGLDHGRDRFSGLAWEHVCSGKAPSDGGRWSAITFDRKRYTACQEPTVERPFMLNLSARTVVFDLPYCDLLQAPRVDGVTSWGAHDPGVAATSRPAGIHQELNRLFGPYPATKWIYGFCWPSAEKARAAGDALAQAVELRARAARWLLAHRLPDWDLAMVVVSESHSAIEPLWHGVDPNHPLHAVESAAPAASGLRKVYVAIDRLVGDLQEAFPDATTLLLAMHGMGPNESDVAAMVLLPELLYRSAFGAAYMRPLESLRTLPDGTPLLPEDADWEEVMLHAVPKCQGPTRLPNRLAKWIELAGFNIGHLSPLGIAWMPAARYSQFWPRMPAFALPAYYDGRVRINVAGREARGFVPADEYRSACDKVSEMLSECRNLLTGEKVIADIICPKQDAHDVGPSEADLYIEWQSVPLGLLSPRCGTIGPVPYRRTGGHTGAQGFLYIKGNGIASSDGGLVSSFDVVPTILDLLGEAKMPGISGRSLAREPGVLN